MERPPAPEDYTITDDWIRHLYRQGRTMAEATAALLGPEPGPADEPPAEPIDRLIGALGHQDVVIRNAARTLLLHPVLIDPLTQVVSLARRFDRLTQSLAHHPEPDLAHLLLGLTNALATPIPCFWLLGQRTPADIAFWQQAERLVRRPLLEPDCLDALRVYLGDRLGSEAAAFLAWWQGIGEAGNNRPTRLYSVAGLRLGLTLWQAEGRDRIVSTTRTWQAASRNQPIESLLAEAPPVWQPLVRRWLPAATAPTGKLLAWRDKQPAALGYLTGLFAATANEGRAAYALAAAVSRASRRVVVTLHNASFGAASGWGMPNLSQQLAPAANYRLLSALRQQPPGSALIATATADLVFDREDRFLLPRLSRLLGRLQTALLINDLNTCRLDDWRERINRLWPQAASLMVPTVTEPEELWPVARIESALNDAIGMAQARRPQTLLHWQTFARLAATGQAMMTTGDLDALVLPMIDKFVRSSHRGFDTGYLQKVLFTLTAIEPRLLILLFDDSTRPNPSLRLVLDQIPGVCGLGIFGHGPAAKADDLPTALLTASIDHHLVALRPWQPLDLPKSLPSLEELLATRPPELLSAQGYNPAWKTDLPFLYAGTVLHELATDGRDDEEDDDLAITDKGRLWMGQYFKGLVEQGAGRRTVAQNPSVELDELEKTLAKLGLRHG